MRKIIPLRSLLSLLSALLIALIFVELGIWQLHRAQELHRPISRVELPTVSLGSITQPEVNLIPSSVNRIVRATGKYETIFSAPGQLVVQPNSQKRPVTLEVRLLKIGSSAGILVVRGVEGSSSQTLSGRVSITGRLYPRQTSDLVDASQLRSKELARLDPALVAGFSSLHLYDGYIIAQSEADVDGQAIYAERIPTPRQMSGTPGYYWQHIAYVFIWWLMALLVLTTPFYNRLKDRIGA